MQPSTCHVRLVLGYMVALYRAKRWHGLRSSQVARRDGDGSGVQIGVLLRDDQGYFAERGRRLNESGVSCCCCRGYSGRREDQELGLRCEAEVMRAGVER